jgi:hypothetical protein
MWQLAIDAIAVPSDADGCSATQPHTSPTSGPKVTQADENYWDVFQQVIPSFGVPAN